MSVHTLVNATAELLAWCRVKNISFDDAMGIGRRLLAVSTPLPREVLAHLSKLSSDHPEIAAAQARRREQLGTYH